MPAIATLTLNPALDITTSVPRLEPVHKLRCAAPRTDPGGGGVNVARVVHELGGDAVAIFPSGGPTGARFEALLRETGVPVLPVPVAGATRESFTVDEAETGQQYRFVLPGAELADTEREALLDALGALSPAPAYIVASGSLPPGVDPAIYCELGARARAIGARLVIDTSGPALETLAGAGAWLIKPSYSELTALAGRSVTAEADQVSAGRELLARGFAEVILVTFAERGALLVTAEGEQRFAAARVDAKSGVGAGDSTIAGIVHAMAQGRELADAVRFGTAAGGAAILQEGTGLARRADVERLYAGMIG